MNPVKATTKRASSIDILRKQKTKYRIIGSKLSNIPWQRRSEPNKNSPVWRYTENPVISRNSVNCANSIFNSAVVPYEGEFAGIFRVDNRCRQMTLHSGRSRDGFNFNISEKPIKFICDDAEIANFVEGYDPRVCRIDDCYYITWCNNYHGYTIGVGYTYDFEKFYQLENAFLPFNRNGVLFPRKIKGKYAMLSRPSDTGHTPFGDIFYSQSPDMEHWGHHRHVISPKQGYVNWESTKVGAGPTPIETDQGWLVFYHGVLTSCNGFVYNMGVVLLDLEDPWKVIYRSKQYLLNPSVEYECVGDVPNVVFPCSALVDSETGRVAIYYGCADTVTSLSFCYADEVIDFLKVNSEL
jgi:beta-1,4-mannooligosaccharide/beta-1,4-mannosyl-N-acetylglucosamine phosphorylase